MRGIKGARQMHQPPQAHDGKRVVSAFVGSAALVLAAVLAFVQALPAARWVGVVILGMIALLTAAREVFIHVERRRRQSQDIRSALRCDPVIVRNADPFALGVTPSEIADKYREGAARPPYVTRDIDSELDELLRDQPFVLIVGPSKAGKSRTAFEAVARVFPDAHLIAPRLPSTHPQNLAAIVDGALREANDGLALIWLDDLQEFLRTRSLSLSDVNSWRASHPRFVVVATIRDSELASLRDARPDGLGAEVERILDQARVVALPGMPSQREAEAANAAYPNESFRDGIGVHFVAGPQLVERLVSGPGTSPGGYALVEAAIDRRRAGVYEPATLDELRELVGPYLQRVFPRTGGIGSDPKQALRWATTPVLQDIGLLLHVDEGPDRYEPFEYITAYREGEVAGGFGREEVPHETWATLIELYEGWVLRAIGYSAATQGQLGAAIGAFEKLSHDPDAHAAAHGLDDLADALDEKGERDRAIAIYRQVAESEYACVAATANYSLARHLAAEDLDAAEAAYRRVLLIPESPVYPKALVNLGLILRERTQVRSERTGRGVGFISRRAADDEPSARDQALEAEALDLFEEAVRSDDREAVANGGNALGVLLDYRGKPQEAEDALAAAAKAGSFSARISLANLIARSEGRREEAWSLIKDLDVKGAESSGYLNLVAGRLAGSLGDPEEAERRYRAAVAVEDLHSGLARIDLARHLLDRDPESEEALHLLHAVIDSGIEEFASEAQAQLDRLDE